MSNEIKAGDLVIVVKPAKCCGRTGSIGQIFTCGEIAINHLGRCTCGQIYRDNATYDATDGSWASLSRLKKIPPLSELESQTSSLDNPIKEPHKEKV